MREIFEKPENDSRYNYLFAENEPRKIGIDLKARFAIKRILENLGASGYFQSPNQLPLYGDSNFENLRTDINLILEHLNLEIVPEITEFHNRKLQVKEQPTLTP